MAADTSGAILTGLIRYEGEQPESPLAFVGDPICDKAYEDGRLRDERVVVDEDGGLANVFVYKSDVGGRSEKVAGDVQLGIKDCAYTPRALGMRIGQTLVMQSSDQTLHSFHPVSSMVRSTSPGLNRGPGPVSRTPKRSEPPFPVRCDVHAWELAYVAVFDHPFYAVTDLGGVFTFLEPLPTGTHQITLWHERLGELTTEVMVAADDESLTLDFTY